MAESIETKENIKDIAKLQTEIIHIKEGLEVLNKEQKALREEQQNGFEKILLKINDLSEVFVKKDIYQKDLERILEEREDRVGSKKWLWRTVGAVVIGIVVSAIVNIFIQGLIGNLQ